MHHVMLDLETLGAGNDAVILSVGAVKFDPASWELGDAFYVDVDPTSCQQLGLTIDATTVMWWLRPECAEARAVLLDTDERMSLPLALDGFAQWFGTETVPVWGNGATFDNVILRMAFKKAGIPCPWEFWHDRCYRTVKSMRPDIAIQRVGTHHNALDDAKSQALHLQRILQSLEMRDVA